MRNLDNKGGMKMRKEYNTNLASEFYILSLLHRLGYSANLTLGNRKAVDILIEKEEGQVLTIDVKGSNSKSSFFIGNVKRIDKRHFIIFVCFQNRIEDVSISPEVFIVPSLQLEKLSFVNPGGVTQVRYRDLKNSEFENKWEGLQ